MRRGNCTRIEENRAAINASCEQKSPSNENIVQTTGYITYSASRYFDDSSELVVGNGTRFAAKDSRPD